MDITRHTQTQARQFQLNWLFNGFLLGIFYTKNKFDFCPITTFRKLKVQS